MPKFEFGINFRGMILKTRVPIGDSSPNEVQPLDLVARISGVAMLFFRRVERRVTVGLAARLPGR
jgi:hypothetical protein